MTSAIEKFRQNAPRLGAACSLLANGLFLAQVGFNGGPLWAAGALTSFATNLTMMKTGNPNIYLKMAVVAGAFYLGDGLASIFNSGITGDALIHAGIGAVAITGATAGLATRNLKLAIGIMMLNNLVTLAGGFVALSAGNPALAALYFGTATLQIGAGFLIAQGKLAEKKPALTPATP